ncbi:hypothetical protein F2P81_007722 [Scophthalmus maximus]|uniref:Uncharacterized protein n=1 Tax=Scophthalmus maximus TaxID=52904 RepID=A0A6A4T0E7_SCOMX|nr:hypothetical protein F2P81_007722 [Scophthalmus maximus]
MVGHMFSNLLLLWSLSRDIFITGLTYDDPKQQFWNNQNLYSVPRDLDVRLRGLDLSNNFIRQLHTLVLPHLEQLDLSSNQLDLISEGAFENLARLEELNLSRNALNNNLGSNSKALQSISRLQSLDISMNGLSDDSAELYLRNKSSLNQLKMTGNALTRLSPSLFKESKGLRAITIDDNLISVIEKGTFEPLSHLEMLNLAKNNLANICDFKLHQVKYLNLSQNSVEFFVTHQDDQFYDLEILDLSFNKLLYFPIVPKMNRLRYLHLQNNLQLDLQSNGLAYISPLFLNALTQIDALNLQDNSVQPCARMDCLSSSESKQIDVNTSCVTFEQLRTLKHLNLKENDIKMLHPNTFQETSLVSLNLAENAHMVIHASGNYFNCCDTEWLAILNESKVYLPDVGDTECFSVFIIFTRKLCCTQRSFIV